MAQGRSLAELRARFRVAAAAEAGVVREEAWQRDGITRWDFGELPERVEVKRGDFVVVGFPALLDRGEDVSLRLLDNRSAAQRATRAGLRRLYMLAEQRELRSQVHWLPRIEEMELFAASLRPARNLSKDLMELLALRAYVDPAPPIRTAEQFEARARREIAKCRSPSRIWHTCCPLSLNSITTPNARSSEAAPWLPAEKTADMRRTRTS